MNIKTLINSNGATKQEKTQHKLELWREENEAMEACTYILRAQRAGLQEQIDAIEAPYLVRIGKLKDQITQLVGEIGSSVTTEGANAKYTKAYDRTSWNNESLRVLAEEHPSILKCIKKVSHIKARVDLKLI